MNNIRKNPGALYNLVFNTLKRKPVTNKIARENFIGEVLSYCNFIYSVSQLEIPKDSILNPQIEYYKKLDILVQRYMSIGNEVIPDDKVETFLKTLQENMLDFCENDEAFQKTLFELEKNHYTELAYKREYSNHTQMDTRIEELKSEAVEVLKYGKNLKYVTFE